FRRAERLSALLRLLVERARLNPDDPIKEYELGVDVFQRPLAYDPRIDPIVRVGMRELRMKLAAYYAGEGAGDPIRIEVRRGGHRAVLPPVAPPELAAPSVDVVELPAISEAAEVVVDAPWQRRRAWAGAIALLLLLTAWPGRVIDIDRA